MHRVKVGEEVLFARDGQRLSELLISARKPIEQPCGGRGVCGKCRVTVDGREELACRYVVKSDIEVALHDPGNIASETGALQTGRREGRLCFALDIGTTTLALALFSPDDGQIAGALTAANPQRAFGADIMTRIEYCMKNSPERLNAVLISEVNRLISAFGAPPVDTMYVAGNATMLHLFFGVDCSSIGHAPYTPVFLESREAPAETLGIAGVKNVISLPSVSSFVGADIVAGMNYIGLPEAGCYNLLIDLGTNAEAVLFSRTSAAATAAAAGPCFEGAGISCGMSATEGAICAFSIDDGKKGLKTISGAPAKGICGTGLIDVVAELLRAGVVDETGFMEIGDYEIADGVTLTQSDIRQFQLAKSAVYSAVLSLMKAEGVSFEQISKMYISGGFSSGINIASAARCGLLPLELSDKAVAVNNSSLLGTVKFASEGSDLSAYLKNSRYIDLSADPFFAGLFIKNMMFSKDGRNYSEE